MGRCRCGALASGRAQVTARNATGFRRSPLGRQKEGPEMSRLRARARAAIAAVTLTVGCTVALGIITAAPAHAAGVCPAQVYIGTIRSGLGNYLDSYGGGSQTYLHTYQFTGSGNQTWCVEKASETRGGFYIHPINPSIHLC